MWFMSLLYVHQPFLFLSLSFLVSQITGLIHTRFYSYPDKFRDWGTSLPKKLTIMPEVSWYFCIRTSYCTSVIRQLKNLAQLDHGTKYVGRHYIWKCASRYVPQDMSAYQHRNVVTMHLCHEMPSSAICVNSSHKYYEFLCYVTGYSGHGHEVFGHAQ